MKLSSHGTYIRPNNVVEIATRPAAFDLETNCRTHKPSTKTMRKLVSKSFTRAGEPVVPRWPVRFKKVPIISSSPPMTPEILKLAKPRFSAMP